MSHVVALYHIREPHTFHSRHELLCFEPVSEREQEEWRPRLHAWMLERLGAGDYHFGLYYAVVAPVDEYDRPDLYAVDELQGQGADIVEDYLCWSGESELVPT